MSVTAIPSTGTRPPFDTREALKESGLAALVVLALTLLMVGARVADVPGGLEIRGRHYDVVWAVAFTFIGRFALILLRHRIAAPVAIIGGAVSAALLVLLLSAPVGDDETNWARDLLPFSGYVVNVLLELVAIIFGVWAVLIIRRGAMLAASKDDESVMDRVTAAVQRNSRYVVPFLLAAAIVFPFMPFADRHLVDIAVLVFTYIMLGWGLNIVVGLAGLLDLGYVAFYAVGAYAYALLATEMGLGFWLCLPFAGMMAALAGVILGFPVLRLRGDYLAIVTLGFGEMIRIILLNWYEITGGPDGVSGIPRPTFFGLPFVRSPAEGTESFHSFFGLTYTPLDRIIFLYYVILMMALVTNLFTLRIRKLPVGRAWEALREDETASRSLGINPRNTKLTAFGIGAMFGGFAGSFFATRQGFISPESFTFIESAVILAIVVLGGMGSQIGVVLAAVVLIGLPEIFRELQEYRMLAFGAAMVLIMIWRPRGLLAYREPTIRLVGKGAGKR